nr:MAG: RNA-dependent RNA polymerase [Crogonang virus 12]
MKLAALGKGQPGSDREEKSLEKVDSRFKRILLIGSSKRKDNRKKTFTTHKDVTELIKRFDYACQYIKRMKKISTTLIYSHKIIRRLFNTINISNCVTPNPLEPSIAYFKDRLGLYYELLLNNKSNEETALIIAAVEGYLSIQNLYRHINLHRCRSKPHVLRHEIQNQDKLISMIRFDGYTFTVDQTKFFESELTPIKIQKKDLLKSRAFNSGTETEFKFEFDNSKPYWDEQSLKFRSYESAFQHMKEKKEMRKWEKLRGQDTNVKNNHWIATAVYMSILKSTFPSEYAYLQECNFASKSNDVWNYIKECKRFTTFLKLNYDHLKSEKNISPHVLFELDNLSGFRRDEVDVDWQTNIGDWLKEKHNMDTIAACYSSYCTLNTRCKPQMVAGEFDREISFNASTYNSSGTAKFESVSMEMLRKEGIRVPKKMPASKTSFNLRTNWTRRRKLMLHSGTLYGYPLKKKEVTKVRYVINTDLASHYRMAPLEKLLINSCTSGVFNSLSKDQADQTMKEWINKPTSKTFICMDQSSFDHYTSKHSFIHLLQYYNDQVSPQTAQTLSTQIKNLLTTFRDSNIFVTNSEKMTRWESGMLSGWKITSIGDSLINLMQTDYCCSVFGVLQQDFEIKVLGDDVLITSEFDFSRELTLMMNEIGLVQHPDKTITSDRYAEFLRVLYDSKDRKTLSYPARMIPALIYDKPWVSSFEGKEDDVGKITSRIQNWRRLSVRLGDLSSCKYFAAVDTALGTKNYSEVHKYAELFTKELVSVEVQPTWEDNPDTKILMATPRIVDPRQANLPDADVEKIAAISNSERFNGRMVNFKSLDFESLKRYLKPVEKRFPKLPALPMPPAWMKRWKKQVGNKEFVTSTLKWGRLLFDSSAKLKAKLKRYLFDSDHVADLWDREQTFKSRIQYFLPVPDNAVEDVRSSAFSNIVMDLSTPLEEVRQKMDRFYSSFNFREYVRMKYNCEAMMN